MKNLSRLLLAMLLVLGFSNTYAQDENNPWAISFGVNAVDVYPVGEDAPQGEITLMNSSMLKIIGTLYLLYLLLLFLNTLVTVSHLA